MKANLELKRLDVCNSGGDLFRQRVVERQFIIVLYDFDRIHESHAEQFADALRATLMFLMDLQDQC